MEVLIEKFGIGGAWIIGTLMFFLRYLLFAGAAFGICYVIWKQQFAQRKIQTRFPKIQRIWHEVEHSFITATVFMLVVMGIYFLKKAGFTQIYLDIADYGWSYLVFSFFLLTILHDTYFYWAHRLMHHPKLFRYFHKVHHISNNPTPWASFSFHPLESLVEIAIVPLVVLIIPFHPIALIAFGTWSILFNVLGHLGYELFPKGFVQHKIWKWINTSTHHNLHHARSNCNYGLYYNFWDRWMGTNAPDYEQQFEQVVNAKNRSTKHVKDNHSIMT